jgi:hypothetical protein
MSDTIYQLIEKYSKVDLPTGTIEFEKVDIDFELYEDRCVNETFQRWGSATGWEPATKAITGIPQTEEHKKKRAESKCREVEIEGVLYKSGKEAAEKLGYCPGAISTWVKRNRSRYGISIPKGSNQYTYGKNRS